jgi:hypothetical protein
MEGEPTEAWKLCVTVAFWLGTENWSETVADTQSEFRVGTKPAGRLERLSIKTTGEVVLAVPSEPLVLMAGPVRSNLSFVRV